MIRLCSGLGPSPHLKTRWGRPRWDDEYLRFRAVAISKLMIEYWNYIGTIQVTGTEISPKVSDRASVKVNLPVASRKVDAITAKFLAGEAPDVTVMISQWDISHTEKSADCGRHESKWHRRQPQRQSRLRGQH